MESNDIDINATAALASPRRYRTYHKKMELILQTAAELFFTKGYHETALADVAKAAKMGKASLYHYIDSKDRLLHEILRQGTEEAIKTYTAIRNENISAPEKIKKLLSAMSSTKERTLQRCLIRPGREVLSEAFRNEIATRSNLLDLLVREILQEGVDRGEIKPLNVIVMTDMLIGASYWSSRHHQPGASVWTGSHQPGKFSSKDLLETWYEAFGTGMFTDIQAKQPAKNKTKRK